MIEINNKKDCCGCDACIQRCPLKCITKQEDNEGFLYPKVDKIICNDCGLCEKVCPVINQDASRKPLQTFAAKNMDEKIRIESSSGGVFTLLAEQTISDGGVVFGAKFNKKWEVVHSFTESINGLAEFRGSKYVQSIIGNSFKEAEEFLKQGRKVLFSGTPCQIAGLNLFLRKNYVNLLTVDIVCHGVPSPKIWRLYLQGILANEGSAIRKIDSSENAKVLITNINFRDKALGWKKFSFTVKTSALENDKNSVLLSETLDKNYFMGGFLKNLYLRPSCHDCPSKSLKSNSDITIADYWGIQKIHADFDDDKGCSLVMCNNAQGVEKIMEIKSRIKFIETSFDNALPGNSSITNSVAAHQGREEFFKQIDKKPIISLINNYTQPTTKKRIKKLVYSILCKLRLILKANLI